MLYLNREEDCQGGTSFVQHIDTGVAFAPARAEGILALMIHDQNNDYAWRAYKTIKMASNRGLIFDASAFHRAEPVGGFGTNNKDARVVLTCFFDL